MAQLQAHPTDLSHKLTGLKLQPRRRAASPPREPPPDTPSLPPPPASGSVVFKRPSRRILSPKDEEVFLASPTYSLILAFIFGVSDSVRDVTITALGTSSPPPAITSILTILDLAEDLLAECPPIDTGSRFGNPAFRTYLDAVGDSTSERQREWHKLLGIEDAAAVEEVSSYLTQSFGNGLRIDYGSGHELNFLMWLLCLNRLSLLPASTFPHVALVVFPRYLRLMRRVQTAYYLEPAGSHGVWGLDDYQFLPFLFGAAQLVHHRYLRPKSIHQAATLEEGSRDFLYLDQVRFVNSVKNVEGLRWHSPMLDDISAAKSWEKVEAGMKKMFVKEVLGKLPVMQHFLFGSLIPAVDGMSPEGDADAADADDLAGSGGAQEVVDENGMRHVHQPNTWGDCCGIKVPSTAGAMGEARKGRGSDGLRRVPFD